LYSNETEEKIKKYCELFKGISQGGNKGNSKDKGEDDNGGISKDLNGANETKIVQDINNESTIKEIVNPLKYPESTPPFKDDIPLRDLTLSKSIFKKNFLNRIIHVEPIKDQKTLIISVVVPSEFKFIGINPYSYIEHFFTREDEKGLVGRIKDKGLGFYADFDLNSYSKYSLLQISIGLTSKGEKDLNFLLKIVEDYFLNFEFIKEEYEKIRDLKELQFFYKEMDEPIDCVESMAEIMQYVPIENVFDYSYILHKYDQKVLEEIVNCIGNRSKWVIFYLKKDLEFDTEDELYGIKCREPGAHAEPSPHTPSFLT
jgi:secreted Zn-dependent insulinase-like peptidase